GGRFLLRIEDTDRARSTEAAVQVIFDSLEWLGLEYDGAPVFQFVRADRHRDVARELVERGWAYRCWMTAEETEEAKAAARAAGHALRSPWRDREPDPALLAQPHVVRFKTPNDGETVIEDAVRGTVAFPNKDLEDLIILRSDGTPTYNLAVTVDDHDMGVTHVIRGEEHLSNAGRQSLMYLAMGWPVPAFGHLPLILGDDGAKMSKRHGAQSVGELKGLGYLPEALRNYLARLGWGHGDDEIFSVEQATLWFDVKDVTKAGARFDFTKLNAINAHYIRAADDGRLFDLTMELLGEKGEPLSPAEAEGLRRALPLVKDGAKTLLDLPNLASFAMLRRPIHLDEKTRARLSEDAVARLGRLRERLAGINDWAAPALDELLKAFVAEEGVKFGEIGPLLRGVLTGGNAAPDLASTLFALQRDEAIGRIDDALSHAV
ncbi:MAG TPA: glutamate--tRNA ligase, partial [Caulobacteraceae bacterium]|nr:glutamate--tRNA ligase [Caulobacteraceae bacterium]